MKNIRKSKNKLLNIQNYNFLGVVFMNLALLASVLPSLLPRPWLLQGLVSALSMSAGYALGVIVSAIYRWLVQSEPTTNIKTSAWKLLKYITPLFILTSLLVGRIWQNQVRSLIGMEKIDIAHSVLIVISIVFFGLIIVSIAKAVRNLSRKLHRQFSKKVPRRLSIAMAISSSILIIYLLVSGIFINGFLAIADSAYSQRDNTVPAGAHQPTSPNRSGGPGSLIPWEKIGFQGRGFVGKGPTQEEISKFSGTPAQDPIRLYAGMASADNAQDQSNLIVNEIQRTKAFDRDVLVIATATGTGWIDPYVADSLELMHNGNTAIVSQQYSYLPSWISFLVDQKRAREAGVTLYDTVVEEWLKLPENDRPKLIIYGLSLGSFGGQEAFGSVNDLRRSVDGALFTGTPNQTALWRRITDRRDAGSPEWQPIYKSKESVAFASSREDITSIGNTAHNSPRILFQQHANDPVTWFNFDLIYRKPDWLQEKRASVVSPKTRWYPFVTFLQVGLDQAIAASAPLGQGHFYHDTATYAWAAVAPPQDWSVQKSDKVQNYLMNQD